ERFMTTIQKNVTEGHLIKINDLNYHISDKGKSWLNRQSDLSTHIFLNGQKYYKTSPVFFKRLQLIIQIWTHAMKEDMQFIPVIDEKEISTWTKAFYRKTKHKAPQYLSQLYDELIKILSVLP